MRRLARASADKDVEILVLGHQLAVIVRRSSAPRLDRSDRSLLAALLHRPPKTRLRQLPLLVFPDMVLRWHRDLLRRRWAATSRPKQAGRPATRRNIQGLAVRLARENPSWGYRRVHRELIGLGIGLAPSSVWEIFKRYGIDPAPRRGGGTGLGTIPSRAGPSCTNTQPSHDVDQAFGTHRSRPQRPHDTAPAPTTTSTWVVNETSIAIRTAETIVSSVMLDNPPTGMCLILPSAEPGCVSAATCSGR